MNNVFNFLMLAEEIIYQPTVQFKEHNVYTRYYGKCTEITNTIRYNTVHCLMRYYRRYIRAVKNIIC